MTEAEAVKRLSRSPHWVRVAMEPVCKLILAGDVGEHIQARLSCYPGTLSVLFQVGDAQGDVARPCPLLPFCPAWASETKIALEEERRLLFAPGHGE